MKSKFIPLLLLGVAALTVLAPGALAQRQLGKKKGPNSKLYLAETKGDTTITTDDKVYTASQATAFDAPGTVIETKADAHNAFVYSNGTGMYVDQNTRVEINRFVQEPFQPSRDLNADNPYEPSVSQSNVHVAHGEVAICTNQLISGSTMTYTTPESAVNIRNGKVSIETKDDATIVDLLEGDVTVRSGGKDVGGQVLRPGERAVIRPGAAGQQPTITIGPIPPDALPALDEHVSIACNAKKTVSFEVIDRATAGGDQEIVPKPTVPDALPSNITVSVDRLPGTTE
jgi:hypothetical protein